MKTIYMNPPFDKNIKGGKELEQQTFRMNFLIKAFETLEKGRLQFIYNLCKKPIKTYYTPESIIKYIDK